ncbi:MAG TPA: protease complex subunit PrcB family protein [Polyangiaceae bacterium]|nr:protease complex subunit PrcB family protein [Polyangiaceae bacterium]
MACGSSTEFAEPPSRDEARAVEELAVSGDELVAIDLTKENAPEGVTLLTSSADVSAFFGGTPTVAVDFSTQWVVHFSLGERPTSGYEAAITGVRLVGPSWRRTLVVSTHETMPGPGCSVAQGTSNPQAAVVIPRPKRVGSAYYESDASVAPCDGGHPEPFCPLALCLVGTVCNEETNACEPAPPEPSGGCVVSGCSNQVCADEPVVTTCEWRPEYACFGQFGVCERDAAGACGWRATPELASCLAGATGG